MWIVKLECKRLQMAWRRTMEYIYIYFFMDTSSITSLHLIMLIVSVHDNVDHFSFSSFLIDIHSVEPDLGLEWRNWIAPCRNTHLLVHVMSELYNLNVPMSFVFYEPGKNEFNEKNLMWTGLWEKAGQVNREYLDLTKKPLDRNVNENRI